MKPVRLTILLLLFCVPFAGAQQSKVDRLQRQLAWTKSEALRLKRMLELSAAWILIDPGMSLMHGRQAIGLATTLRGMLQKVAASSVARFTVEIEEIDKLLGEDDGIKLYRLVQEIVNNILKHAGATEASMRLQGGSGSIRLRVSDNGRGSITNDSGKRNSGTARLGLRSMTERVRMLGRTMTIDSSPGRGTTIDINLPVTK